MRFRQAFRTPLIALCALAVALAGAPGLAAGPSPAAAEPPVGGAPSLLGIAVGLPVVLSQLTPGTTSTAASTILVTSTGAWVLRVSDAAVAHPGHMLRTTGTTGAAFLAAPLTWSTTPAVGGTGGTGALTGTAATAASGGFTNAIVTGFSQPVGSGEQLAAGATYAVTVTWTVSPT